MSHMASGLEYTNHKTKEEFLTDAQILMTEDHLYQLAPIEINLFELIRE